MSVTLCNFKEANFKEAIKFRTELYDILNILKQDGEKDKKSFLVKWAKTLRNIEPYLIPETCFTESVNDVNKQIAGLLMM
jgi:hypothetical protein